MAYEGTDEEGNKFRSGEPSPEEEAQTEKEAGEFDPEEHPEDYIMRM